MLGAVTVAGHAIPARECPGESTVDISVVGGTTALGYKKGGGDDEWVYALGSLSLLLLPFLGTFLFVREGETDYFTYVIFSQERKE